MAEQQTGEVSVTLKLDPKVHEAFLRKAQQANMDLESFLGSTLTIVLGCRVFNEQYSCSPAKFIKKPNAENDRCDEAA